MTYETKISEIWEKIIKMKSDIDELKKSKMELISIRDGFVALERFIFIEITESKKQARKFDGIQELFNSPEY